MATHQKFQQAEFLGRQIDVGPCTVHAAAQQVQLQITDADRREAAGVDRASTQDGPDAAQEFREGERLFEEVFNATLERVDAALMMVASIQEKHGNQRILTPERLQQFTARHAFQGGVDDQEIEHLQRCQFQRLNAAFGKVDGESGLAQTEAVVVASLEVVFEISKLNVDIDSKGREV